MSIQTKSSNQGLLFSEPAYSETAVWCELNDGIDPAEWAYLCRFLGKMEPEEFKKVEKKVFGNPDTLIARFKRIFTFKSVNMSDVPLVCWGTSGIFGDFQVER